MQPLLIQERSPQCSDIPLHLLSYGLFGRLTDWEKYLGSAHGCQSNDQLITLSSLSSSILLALGNSFLLLKCFDISGGKELYYLIVVSVGSIQVSTLRTGLFLSANVTRLVMALENLGDRSCFIYNAIIGVFIYMSTLRSVHRISYSFLLFLYLISDCPCFFIGSIFRFRMLFLRRRHGSDVMMFTESNC